MITIVILIGIVCVVAYSRVRAGGLSAEPDPGNVERAIASRLVRLSIPSDAKEQTSPFAGDPTIWKTAADHYRDHCAVCHGNDGHARTDAGQNMYPKTPDFADEAVQQLSDGELFYIIQNGVRWTGMPAWQREHSGEDSWRLVSFVRAVPKLTHDDLESAGLGATEHDEHHGHEHGADMHYEPKR